MNLQRLPLAFKVRENCFSKFVKTNTFVVLMKTPFFGRNVHKWGRPPLPSFKNRKKVPRFWKKGPNCVHPWVESSIQNVVLRVSRGKSSKIFSCGAFFCVFDEKFIRVS